MCSFNVDTHSEYSVGRRKCRVINDNDKEKERKKINSEHAVHSAKDEYCSLFRK